MTTDIVDITNHLVLYECGIHTGTHGGVCPVCQPPQFRCDYLQWVEAWSAGYVACQDGVPNDETIIQAIHEAYKNSGAQQARRLIDAMEKSATA